MTTTSKPFPVRVPASATGWVHPLTAGATLQNLGGGTYAVSLDGSHLGTLRRRHTNVSTRKGGLRYWEGFDRLGSPVLWDDARYWVVSRLITRALERAASL